MPYFVSEQGRTTCCGCIAGFTNYFKKSTKPTFFEFTKKEMCVTDKELKRFIKIMIKWEFPVELVEKEELYQIHYNPEKFTTNKHFLAAYTMSRYFVKDRYIFNYFETDKVISQTFEYKKKYKKLDMFQCFQLAQYKTMPGNHDGGHSCFKNLSKLVTLKEMQKKIPNLQTVNALFYKAPVDGFGCYNGWEALHKLINKDEEAALKLLL